MNIHGYAEKNQKAMSGQHILSFLWDRTGGDKESGHERHRPALTSPR